MLEEEYKSVERGWTFGHGCDHGTENGTGSPFASGGYAAKNLNALMGIFTTEALTMRN